MLQIAILMELQELLAKQATDLVVIGSAINHLSSSSAAKSSTPSAPATPQTKSTHASISVHKPHSSSSSFSHSHQQEPSSFNDVILMSNDVILTNNTNEPLLTEENLADAVEDDEEPLRLTAEQVAEQSQ